MTFFVDCVVVVVAGPFVCLFVGERQTQADIELRPALTKCLSGLRVISSFAYISFLFFLIYIYFFFCPSPRKRLDDVIQVFCISYLSPTSGHNGERENLIFPFDKYFGC